METQTYNGWTNYATWNVNLWLSNSEGMYHDVRRLARRAIVANTTEGRLTSLPGRFRST